MTPAILDRLARAVRSATALPPERSHRWMTVHLLPAMERAGLTVVDAEYFQTLKIQHYDLMRDGAA